MLAVVMIKGHFVQDQWSRKPGLQDWPHGIVVGEPEVGLADPWASAHSVHPQWEKSWLGYFSVVGLQFSYCHWG